MPSNCHVYRRTKLEDGFVVLTHRIRLCPTKQQEELFLRACGIARFAYNWGLFEWRKLYAEGTKVESHHLAKRFNAIKDEQFPWVRDVPATVTKQAFANLGWSYANFFRDLKLHNTGHLKWSRIRFPRFKKKGVVDSFKADNGPDITRVAVHVDGRRVRINKIGWVRMREELRFFRDTGRWQDAKILSLVVKRRADHWHGHLAVAVRPRTRFPKTGAIVGVDVGINYLAVTSDGYKASAPRPLARHLRHLRRVQRNLTRKQIGSKNRAKAKTKLARLHARIADVRRDAIHKLTTRLVHEYDLIGIENLHIVGMRKNHTLSRTVLDLGFSFVRPQLEYKTVLHGRVLVVAPRSYPSSKICSVCRRLNKHITFANVVWTCRCGARHDRDINAAINLRNVASSAMAACGGWGSGDEQKLGVTLRPKKQEVRSTYR